MSELSEWLVASDIDGTLLDKKLFHIPKRNIEAIDRLINVHGGNFTLASGRGEFAVRKHYDSIPGKKCPAVVYNGAGIYDFEQEKMLWFSPINEEQRNFAKMIMRKFPNLEAEVYTPERIYQVNPGISAAVMSFVKRPKLVRAKTLNDIPQDDWAKIVFYGVPAFIQTLRSYVKLNTESTTNFMDSSPMTYEMVNSEANKWLAIVKLAEIMGIDKKKIAVIGDHYNDYEMLKNAPVSACCGQSPRGIKYVAKMQTCHCNRGAVADLIEYLEERYNK